MRQPVSSVQAGLEAAAADPSAGTRGLDDGADWEDAQEALRASEHRFRELVENANDIVFTHDLSGRFTSVNGAGERLMGYTRDELLGLTFAQIVAPGSLLDAQHMLRPRLDGEERPLYDIDVIAKDGRCLALEVSTWLLRRNGVAVGVQGIARDVTDRKRAEEALRQSEERFRLIVENSSEGLWLVARDGIIFYASGPACRVLGHRVEELVGRHVLDYVHADDRDRASWVIADCVSKPGLAIPAQFRCRHRDGSYRDLEGVGVNRLDEPGVGAIVINFRDVTDRLRTGEALQESQERFRAVFDSALMAIIRLDLHGRIVDANRAALTLAGHTLDEARGKAIVDFLHPDDVEETVASFRQLASGARDSYQAERRYLVKGGRVIWAIVSASLVRDAHGKPSFCIALLENITERKRAEAELLETNKRLSVWVQELEQRTREISLLSELGDMLQACKMPDEAYMVVAPIATQLFPGACGQLSIVAPAASTLEPVARWGAQAQSRPFSIDECWAIRRGRPHLVEDVTRGVVCRHLSPGDSGAAACVPLMAHGELLGLFTLVMPDVRGPIEPKRRLAMTVAEHVALALANLRLHDTLRSQSIRDPLTGLFNRRYMEESLQREMRRAARGRQPVGIIMLDIDHFKEFNDNHGHEAGDVLLQAVGAILQRSVRAEDIACRYGGEEFTLILPEASLSDAAQRADHVRQAISHLHVQHHRQHLAPITVSAGVAIYPDHGPTGDAVLRAADAALYQAKTRGRNRVVLNKPSGFVESDWRSEP
jgi:diguanylate cyclase (GGDEF)-like protein/PAS domain S-box-containing protein